MEKTIVTTGKTIDLAIEAALAQLALDRDSVSVQVLSQAKPGFLGIGAQPAKVQVTYEAPDPAPEAPKTFAPAEPGSTEEKIETFIKGLLEKMGSDAVPHAWKDGESTYKVELTGSDLGYLIGRRGDTLDAIQHLANYTVNRDVEGHIRINVDAESYREKREDSLRRYARKKAQQVLKNRRRTTLEPMNAYERHVIHATLQEMENITTYSTGTEPNRRVVVEYVR